MMLIQIGFIVLVTSHFVDGQGAAFTEEVCDDAPCSNENFTISFRLSGTPPATAARTVAFYRNGESGFRACNIDRLSACNPDDSCGCTDVGGGVRIYHYKKLASVAEHNGDWSAILQATNTADTVRSPVCRVQVNASCPYFVRDACPTRTLTRGDVLSIDFVQTRTFPNTAGESLNFIVNGTRSSTEGTVTWKTCPSTTQSAGCFQRDGKTVYYLNTTARVRHTGTWTVVVDASNADDSPRSDPCEVKVVDPEAFPTSVGLLCTSAGLTGGYIIVIIVLLTDCCCITDRTKKSIVAFVGAALVLIFVIVIGAYSLGTRADTISFYEALYNANIAFVIIGVLATIGGIISGSITLSQRYRSQFFRK